MNEDTDFTIAQQLGELRANSKNAADSLEAIGEKIDEHIRDEEGRLTRIEQQLSLTRFLWLVLKAFVLTLAFILAFKFGDIKDLWAALK